MLSRSAGKAYPLYPWREFKWESRPAEELPQKMVLAPPDDASLKLNQVNAFEFTEAERGMESILVVVRNSRWDLPNEQIRDLFLGLKADHVLVSDKAFVAFDNGVAVPSGVRTRGFDVAAPVNAPHLQIQNLLARRLQPHAAYTTAVSFAKVEK